MYKKRYIPKDWNTYIKLPTKQPNNQEKRNTYKEVTTHWEPLQNPDNIEWDLSIEEKRLNDLDIYITQLVVYKKYLDYGQWLVMCDEICFSYPEERTQEYFYNKLSINRTNNKSKDIEEVYGNTRTRKDSIELFILSLFLVLFLFWISILF